MKLTINHLAPYLPYGLEGQIGSSGGTFGKLLGLKDEFFCYAETTYTKWPGNEGRWNGLNLHDFKPLLLPLSKLTEEIEHNGKKYCILSLWYSLPVKEEEAYEVYGTIPEYWKTVVDNIEKNGLRYIDYGFVKILLEHHFDCFKLIPNGLALDKSTINQHQP